MIHRLAKGNYSIYSVLSANLMADFFFNQACRLAHRAAGGLAGQGSSNET